LVKLLVSAKSQNTFKLSICMAQLNAIIPYQSNMNDNMNRKQFVGDAASSQPALDRGAPARKTLESWATEP
jgi:hypothetical protein